MKGFNVSCIITGEEKYVGGASLQNKLKKFGTQEVLEKYYVSRPAAKLLKTGLSVDEVRQKLGSKLTKSVDYEVLFKLKLLKKKRARAKSLSSEERIKAEAESQANQHRYEVHVELIKSDKRAYVEWATGGPNKCQVPYGGTCIRPDIYYNNEYSKAGRCNTCPYSEYCLCTSKVVT
jgi:hypothetical protein